MIITKKGTREVTVDDSRAAAVKWARKHAGAIETVTVYEAVRRDEGALVAMETKKFYATENWGSYRVAKMAFGPGKGEHAITALKGTECQHILLDGTVEWGGKIGEGKR